MPDYPDGVNSTGQGQWPFDDGTMVPFGPDSQKRLADRISLLAGAGIAYCPTLADRDALLTNGDAFPGLKAYVASQDIEYRLNQAGTGWNIFRPYRQRSQWFEQLQSGGGIVNASATVAATQRAVSFTGQTPIARVHASIFTYLGTASAYAGYLRLLVDGTPLDQAWRFHNHARQGPMTFLGDWDVNLSEGDHTLQVRVVTDAGIAPFELWDFQVATSVEA